MPNRLADATSPYLLQHADNPVDWWEWGEEAFGEARKRNVPVLLSVGYAACHWCHEVLAWAVIDGNLRNRRSEGVLWARPFRAVSPLDAVSEASCITLVYHSAGLPGLA